MREGAIDKIERFNVCIIAESVWLSKAFETLAKIKCYELRNVRGLILYTKKIVMLKDSGFKDGVVKTYAIQVFKTAGIVDVRSL